MSILAEIFAHKRVEVAQRKAAKPLSALLAEVEAAPPPLDFTAALQPDGLRRVSMDAAPRLIAEVKRASPSRGVLVTDFDPLRLAQIYQENGAAAISVLTDEHYFRGSLEDLRCISLHLSQNGPRLPLLRKDFIADPYQVYEARAAGADAVLLIAACLEPGLLRDLHGLAVFLGMAPLVEVHNLAELELALTCEPELVGINNRDLRDFSVSLETALRLRPFVPPGVCVIAESGIHTPQDVARLAAAGIDAILVGEALVTAPDIAAKVRSLSSVKGKP